MKYFVANWKQYKTHQEAISWCTKNIKSLTEFGKKTSIILCPSFDALKSVHTLLEETAIKLGAQNCSANQSGAHTGEISAQSLHEIGCTHCIIGHSERYQHFGETPKLVTQKALLLLQNNITPIICINENNPEQQLEIISHALQKSEHPHKKILIAYEPTWAIGTGQTPDNASIENTTTLFQNKLKILQNYSIDYLYGGSVSENNIDMLCKLNQVDGFLVGKASTDIDQTKKMLFVMTKY